MQAARLAFDGRDGRISRQRVESGAQRVQARYDGTITAGTARAHMIEPRNGEPSDVLGRTAHGLHRGPNARMLQRADANGRALGAQRDVIETRTCLADGCTPAQRRLDAGHECRFGAGKQIDAQHRAIAKEAATLDGVQDRDVRSPLLGVEVVIGARREPQERGDETCPYTGGAPRIERTGVELPVHATNAEHAVEQLRVRADAHFRHRSGLRGA